MRSLKGQLQPALFTFVLPLFAYALLHLSSQDLLAQKLLLAYNSFPLFIFMMLSLTLILNLSSIKSSKRTFSKTENRRSLFKKLFLYSIFYCCYHLLFPQNLFPSNQEPTSLPQVLRVLEQQAQNNFSISASQNPENEQLSLSVGRLVSSIVIDGYAMTSSKDGRFLYVLDKDGNTLQILDVSNIKTPVISGTLRWLNNYVSECSMIQLSDDEKTIFVSNFNDLQIIDVSNPTQPILLGRYDQKKNKQDRYGIHSTLVYKVSLVTSPDGKYLFAAGFGLRVFDVSNSSNPTIALSRISDDKDFPANALALSIDPSYLFIAGQDKDLVVSNISDPNTSVVVKSFPTEQIANSLILSNDKKTAFVLSTNSKTEVSIQKINVSDPLSPESLKHIPLPNIKSFYPPSIMAKSPCGRYLFISIISVVNRIRVAELRMFDTIEEKILSPNRSLVSSALALMFLPKSGYLVSSSMASFTGYVNFFELFSDFQNRKTFGLSEGPIDKSFFVKNNSQFFLFSADRKTLFTSASTSRNGTFEIINISPRTILSSFFVDKEVTGVSVSPDNSKAILLSAQELIILDISNKVSPKLLANYTVLDPPDYYKGIELDRNEIPLDWFISNQTVVIFFIKLRSDMDDLDLPPIETNTFKIFNISDPSNITQQVSPFIGSRPNTAQMAVTKDRKTAFLCKSTGDFWIYDFSNISNPVLLSFFIHKESEGTQNTQSCILSPDESVLAIRHKDPKGISKLKLFNVSNLRNPTSLSQTTIPKRLRNLASPRDMIFSLDQRTIYIAQNGSLLSLDISDISKPQILGILPNSEINYDNYVTYMRLAPDGDVLNVLTSQGKFYQMSRSLAETLFITKEVFGLGEKFSDTLSILKQNELKEYEMVDTSTRKLIQSRFVNLDMVGLETSTRLTSLLLPDWIRINPENNLLTIHAMSQYDIDPYTLCSSFSKKLSKNAFDGVSSSYSSEEVITALISMGYLDTQLFITNKLSTLEYFFLPSPYNQKKENIYQTVKTHLVEACSHFEVISSLSLITTEPKLRIKTPSSYVVKLNIEVEPKGRFLTKSYGLLQPLIGEKSLSVTLEGSTKEINSLLQKLVIDMVVPGTICSGNITINDQLNPPITTEIADITKYLIKNVPPVMNQNMTIQYQVDQASIYTGQYFALDIAKNTFIDNNADKLNYNVVLNKKGDNRLPQWLIYNDLSLKGTPPEELFNRDIDLLIVVENEFKQVQISFRIHISISMTYAIKLVIKNSPYIFSILGLIIYFNKIFNILGKRFYKHSKMYNLKTDEEVTSNVIFPVFFVRKENQEKSLILKLLSKTVCQKLFCKSLNKYQVLSYFLDQGGKLDKLKLVEMINEAVSQEITRKDLLYLSDNQPRKTLIIQLIINTLVDWQLDLKHEAATKKVFDRMKQQYSDFIECTPSGRFVVNQIALQREILGSDRRESLESFSTSSEDVKERLLKETLTGKMGSSQVNQDLLENALISYVYKQQSVYCFATDVRILKLQQVPRMFILRFLKKDLREIQIDYGFNFKIQNGVLSFSGTPTHDFPGNTVVIQVVNRKQKIMKEIWIEGVKNQDSTNDVSSQLDEPMNYWKDNYSVL